MVTYTAGGWYGVVRLCTALRTYFSYIKEHIVTISMPKPPSYYCVYLDIAIRLPLQLLVTSYTSELKKHIWSQAAMKFQDNILAAAILALVNAERAPSKFVFTLPRPSILLAPTSVSVGWRIQPRSAMTDASSLSPCHESRPSSQLFSSTTLRP